MENEKKRGMIFSNPKGIFRVEHGIAGDREKERQYQVCTLFDKSPMIESCLTGKCFTIPWPEIVKMAQESGIDD